MFKRRIVWAILLTLVLYVSGIFVESRVDINNKAWRRFEAVMNFPGGVLLMLVGPGHGIPQLVLPFIFSLAFYIAVFWLLIVLFERLRKKRGEWPKSEFRE
jgi:TRAP-type C4-dicarboxylate transport system permease small subunit